MNNNLVSTARIAGIWYLMLAISGMVGFLLLHPQIYATNDSAKTLANLTEHETLARIRLAVGVCDYRIAGARCGLVL
jgi:hypothetical protein